MEGIDPIEAAKRQFYNEFPEDRWYNRLRAWLVALPSRLLAFLRDILRPEDGTDMEAMAATIRRDTVFKGANVWVLICSIVVASVGLNINNTAVVIGAMVIAPLLWPILAIGMAVGTYDWDTLKLGWRNFAVMVGVALTASTAYFLITPLSDAQSELLLRTRPTLLDALIAVFGGLAAVIGISRRTTYANVVPGVAIATALMPPLCTAGYGLATAQWEYVIGALYLFLINAILISGATLVVVRYLGFPLVRFVNKATERRVRAYMAVSVIVVLLPSAWIFYDVVKETVFMRNANRFVAENCQFDGTEIMSRKLTYSDTLPRIDLYVMGEPVSEEAQMAMRKQMVRYGLKDVAFRIHQPQNVPGDLADKLSQELRVGVLEDIYERNARLLEQKDAIISRLSAIVDRDSIPFEGLHKEIRIQYPEVKRLAYARTIEMGRDGEVDSIPTFLVRWDNTLTPDGRTKREQVMKEWLKARLELDTVRVVRY